METTKITLSDGFFAAVEFRDDTDAGRPWEERDGHGCIREGLRENKHPGERVLGPTGTRDIWYLYDIKASTETAKREGWDAEPYGGTKGERAARAVAADFEYLRAWCADEWRYVGVCVSLRHESAPAVSLADDSLWCVETWKDYHHEAARDIAVELLAQHGRESREREYWAARGALTVAG